MPSLKLKRVKPTVPVAKAKVLVRKIPNQKAIAAKVLADIDGPLNVKPRDNVIAPAKKLLMRRKPSASIDTTEVDKHAKAYNITLANGDNRTVKGFVVTGLGDVLGVTGVTATRWEKSGMIPKPIFGTGRGAIYHIEEVRSFYRLLNEHQKDHRQYRAEHAELRKKLFSENAHIRRGLFPTE